MFGIVASIKQSLFNWQTIDGFSCFNSNYVLSQVCSKYILQRVLEYTGHIIIA